MKRVLAILALVATSAHAQSSAPPRTVDDWLKIESPEAEAHRDSWSRPDSVVRVLGIQPGDIVADLGCGSGYWARHIARATAPGGRVLALDIDPVRLEVCRILAARAGLDNIETRLVEPHDAGLAHDPVDLVFLSNVWHILPDRIAYAARLRRSLPPGCRLAILTWDKKLPPARSSSVSRPDRFEVRRAAEAAGWVLEAEHDFIATQHFLVFSPGVPDLFVLVPEARYLNAHLLIGRRPDSLGAAVEALRARGFLTVLELTSGIPIAATGAPPDAVNGLRWLRLPLDTGALEEPTLLRFLEEIQSSDTGVVFAFGEHPEEIVAVVAALHERGILSGFSESEVLDMLDFAGDAFAPVRRAVDAALNGQ